MRGVFKIAIVLFLVLVVVGLLLPAVSQVRHAAAVMNCQNNLSGLGMGLQHYHDGRHHFPGGTVPHSAISPDKRLSWLTQICPAYIEGGILTLLDPKSSWDSETNCPPRCRVKTLEEGNGIGSRERPMGEVRYLLCPSNSARNDPSLPSPTHYVGVAGLGDNAAELPLADPRAGFFGYDREISVKDIKDGLATTMAVTEVMDGGPWTAGGRATVRGLVAGEQPYLGEGGQFASLHQTGVGLLGLRSVVITNVLFADASVRRFTGSTSSQVFEAIATIAGGEQVEVPQ